MAGVRLRDTYRPASAAPAPAPATAGRGTGRLTERQLRGDMIASGLGASVEAMAPIGQVVGTVEPTRFFDRRFRPTSEAPRTRFERIAADIRSGRGMDPVDLYRCAGEYYVLDGRHRIAVARALGERWVLANITDVRLNCPGVPNLI